MTQHQFLAALVLPITLAACASTPAQVDPKTPILTVGAWSNPTTWANGAIPADNAVVNIPAGKRIVLDKNVALKNLTINGVLEFADSDVQLNTDWIMIENGGELRVGSELKPYTKKATITLTATDQSENIMGMGTKCLCVMMGGKLELHGEQRVSWTKLGSSAAKGADSITLSEDIDWRKGERIVVASSALDSAQAEERGIASVQGRTVTLDVPLQHAHYGVVESLDAGRVNLDERAEVGLLSRNIVVQGDADSTATRFGGHIMAMGSDSGVIEMSSAYRSSARVSGVELRRMGQLNRLGRYPFHWHFNGSSQGDYLKNSAIHDSIQRGVVIHNTSDVLVQNNVVWKSPGHAFVIEAGGELNNSLERNLSINPQPVTFTQTSTNGILSTQHDERAAGYWITGKNNIFRGNSAAGGQFGGFWFDKPKADANYALVFENNTVHSHGSSDGAGLWLQSGWDSNTIDYNRMKFKGLTAYKNSKGFWADGVTATLDSSLLADNRVAMTGNANITSSVVIGRSANLDSTYRGFAYSDRWGGVGIDLYNNRSDVTDVTFINFPAPDANPINSSACRNESVRVRTKGLRFVNAAMSYCKGDTLFEDVDGSLSGTGKPSTVVSDPLMYTSKEPCTSTSSSGAVVCDGKMDQLYVFVQRDLRLASRVTMTRAIDGLTQDMDYFPGFAIALPGGEHTLDKGLDVLPSLNLYIAPASSIGSSASLSSRIVVNLPAPDAKFRVYRGAIDGCYTCGFNATLASYRNELLTSAADQTALLTADGDAYFYDSSAKQLHLILKRDKPVFLERTN